MIIQNALICRHRTFIGHLMKKKKDFFVVFGRLLNLHLEVVGDSGGGGSGRSGAHTYLWNWSEMRPRNDRIEMFIAISINLIYSANCSHSNWFAKCLTTLHNAHYCDYHYLEFLANFIVPLSYYLWTELNSTHAFVLMNQSNTVKVFCLNFLRASHNLSVHDLILENETMSASKRDRMKYLDIVFACSSCYNVF